MKSPAPRVEVLTAAEVADLLRIAVKTLHNNTAAGLFPRGAKLPGVGLRWRRDAVDAWLGAQFADRGA